MSNSEMNGLPPCKQLFIVGPPGAGKKTLQRRLAKCLRWKTRTAVDFHTEEALTRIRSGTLVTSAEYWLEYFEGLSKFYRHMKPDQMNISLVFAGTFLTKSLRRRLVMLDSGSVSNSSYYVIWLRVTEDVAKARLARRLEENEEAFFQPEWVSHYFSAMHEPQVVPEARPEDRLLRTAEPNVWVLDADREEVGIKANFILNRIPGLKEQRWE